MVRRLDFWFVFHQKQNASFLILIVCGGYVILNNLHPPVITVAFKQAHKIISIYNLFCWFKKKKIQMKEAA